MTLHKLSTIAFLGAGLYASALPFNGSFELGTDGFALIRYLRTDTNLRLNFIPLQLDSGADNCGKNSLKLANPYRENYNIFSKEFKLEADTTYHFEGKIRSANAGEKVYLGIFKVDPAWSAESIMVNTDVEWKKFSKTFTTKKTGYYHILIRPGKHDEATSNTLWFDDLKLARVNAPQSGLVEAITVPDRNLYTAGVDNQAEFSLKIFNPGPRNYKESITVTGVDEYRKNTLFQKNFTVELAPGETKQFHFSEALKRFGSVRVQTSGKNLSSHDGFYSVIGEYKAAPVDITRDYVVGLNGGLYFQQYPQTKYPSYQCFNAPFGRHIELLSKTGCRIMRDHDGGVRGVDWPAVEWNQGKFDFSHLDRQLDLYEKNNITLFPVIGQCFIKNDIRSRWQNQNLPLWVLPLAEHVKENPPNCIKSLQDRILLPPRKLFENYVRQTVKHINGRVPVYEITNEPNLYFSPETYVEYLKIASSAIRSVQSDAKITGFCLSSDFNASSSYPWMEKCIKLGGLDYVQALSFHPYGGRELGAIYPADKYIADLRKFMASHRVMPLWNTELYYLIDHNARHNSYEESLCQPHHVAWRFLVDLGEGVTQSIAIPGEYLWKRMLTPNMLTVKNFQELIPSENFVTYNALARFFEGAKTIGKFRYSNGGICYVYDKKGEAVAAIWNYLKIKGVVADLSEFDIYDVFGNSEKAGEKELEDAPLYLKPGKLTKEEFLNRLKNLKPELRQPVLVAPLARQIGDTLLVTLYNTSEKQQSGFLGLSGSPAAEKPVSFQMASGNTTVPVALRKGGNDIIKTSIQLASGGRLYSFPIDIVRNRHLTSSGKFRMENAEGTISFDKTTVRLSLEVRDATQPGTPKNAEPWQTDSVELFFDSRPEITPMRHPHNYTDHTFRLFVVPHAKQKLSSMGEFSCDTAHFKLDPTPTGYRFDLSFPRQTGRYLGFDVKINDFSKGKKLRETTLSGKAELYRDRCNFTIVEKEK